MLRSPKPTQVSPLHFCKTKGIPPQGICKSMHIPPGYWCLADTAVW